MNIHAELKRHENECERLAAELAQCSTHKANLEAIAQRSCSFVDQSTAGVLLHFTEAPAAQRALEALGPVLEAKTSEHYMACQNRDAFKANNNL